MEIILIFLLLVNGIDGCDLFMVIVRLLYLGCRGFYVFNKTFLNRHKCIWMMFGRIYLECIPFGKWSIDCLDDDFVGFWDTRLDGFWFRGRDAFELLKVYLWWLLFEELCFLYLPRLLDDGFFLCGLLQCLMFCP